MPLLETKGAASAQGFGEFAKVGAANYIEDVFSTWLYTGNGSTQTITNGIDLAGKGGLVWLKSRASASYDHQFVDTARGSNKYINSNNTNAETTNTNRLTAFNADGFTLGASAQVNEAPATGYAGTYASWTFRKQPKFFDMVTYTGTGSARTIAHSLGSVPGCMIIKRTDAARDWAVYHRSSGATKGIYLNSTAAEFTSLTALWNGTTPTSTEFSVGTNGDVNASGGTYVAYLFAHDAGGFGLTGADNVISCGSYTGNGSASGPTITLGYEPQWIMLKNTNNGATNWAILDNMRGIPVGSDDQLLFANTSGAESAAEYISPTATGFRVTGTFAAVNENGSNIIYIAIRRGPMKTPTTGTSVYYPTTYTGTGATNSLTGFGFPPDLSMISGRSSNLGAWLDRLRGPNLILQTRGDQAETATTNELMSFDQNGVTLGSNFGGGWTNVNTTNYVTWEMRRAPGFFDVVCYTGTGSNTTQAHNLGVVPELMIVKRRSTTNAWAVYANNDNTDYLVLNTDAATADDNTYWNDTTPTSSVFSIGTNNAVNASGSTYVAYLFATVSGVSKVGSYTGTGTTKQIDCGFTGGARLVIIKRTDSTGDWYCWDSSRGIVSGNDSYLVLNSTAAEVTNTDWVDTYSAGFELSNAAGNNVNINGGTFIFLAIA